MGKAARLRAMQAAIEELEAAKKAILDAGTSSSEESDDKLVPDSPSPRKRRKVETDHFKSGAPSREFLLRRQDRALYLAMPPVKAREQPVESRLPPERHVSESSLLDRISNVGRDKRIATTSRTGRKSATDEALLEALKAEKRPSKRAASPKNAVKQADLKSGPVKREASQSSADELEVTDRPKKTRHKDGTVIEEFIIGPHDFKPPLDDPDFLTYEPYSGIHLKPKSRELSHADLNEFMDQRAALSPALLYSLARGAQQRSGSIELACDNEVVVFGVLAWKDEVRYTRADALRNDSNRPRKPWEVKDEVREEDKDEIFRAPTKRQKQKRYIRFEMVDLSTPDASQAGTGRVHLTLFEADTEETIEEDDGYQHKTYSGGSYGLFEKLWKVPAGTVVAVLGPRVSKYQPPPGQQSENILTLTPELNADVQVIGLARDWGTCQAIKRDGKPCMSWRDTRVQSPYCSFHKQVQVKRVGARRAETFSAQSNTHHVVSHSGSKFQNSLKAGHKKVLKPDPDLVTPETKFDPVKKTGLLPRDTVSLQGGEKTYCVAPMRKGKFVVNTAAARRAAAIESGNGSGGYIPGVREGPTVAEAHRKLEEELKGNKRSKRERDDLLAADGGNTVGGAYLLARSKRDSSTDGESSRKRRSEADSNSDANADDSDSSEGERSSKRKDKKPFSGSAIQKIGFDPTANGSKIRDESHQSRKIRMGMINSLAATERESAKLSAPKGRAKVRSGVVAPARETETTAANETDGDEDLPDLVRGGGLDKIAEPESEDDLFIEDKPE